jgi:hypothetical protein
MSDTTTHEQQRGDAGLDEQLERLNRSLDVLAQAVDKLEERWLVVEETVTDRLNEAYQQGVRDATKARTGVDPAVEDGDDG